MDDDEIFPVWFRKAYKRYYFEYDKPKSNEYLQKEAELINKAGWGLSGGDLTPFAEYLKSEFSNLEPDLALELVSMIEQ